jgi:predicted CXXCH cytochrome family protein
MKVWNRVLYMTILLFILAPVWMLTGCNKYTRYKVLTAVFDGVPHPDDVTKEVTALEEVPFEDQEGRLAFLPVRYTHPSAGTEGGCALCHGPPKDLIIPGKDMCVRCHAHVREKKPFIHGPAVLDCIVCHEPHESKTKSLLKIIGNELCFECHYRQNREDAYTTEEHRDLEEKEFVCLSCHDPHGGKDRFFVREGGVLYKKDLKEDTLQEGILEETETQEDMRQLENRENDRVQ